MKIEAHLLKNNNNRISILMGPEIKNDIANMSKTERDAFGKAILTSIELAFKRLDVLESLYFSTIGDKTVGDIRGNTTMIISDIVSTLESLVKERWVLNQDSILSSTEETILEGKYRLGYMGRMKLEWLTGVNKKD